jgi:hypothetical protein
MTYQQGVDILAALVSLNDSVQVVGVCICLLFGAVGAVGLLVSLRR